MKINSMKTAIIATSIILLSACNDKKSEDNKMATGEVIAVKTMPLQPLEQGKTINASGQFSTEDEVVLSFKTGGIINQLLVKEGDYIHKGQLLAKLDLTEINAALNQSKLAVSKATRDFERVNNLYKDSTATLEQLQNTRTALDLAKQQNSAAQFNYNYSEIRALENGYVLKKFANVGQLVTSGESIIQTNGATKNKWILKVGVSDSDWGAITVGDKVKIKIDALPNQLINAKVIRKSQGIDASNGTLAVDIEVESNYNKYLAAGMYGAATIQTRITSKVWQIPYDAILDSNGGEGFVFVTNDNKVAVKVPVKITAIDKNTASISEGLMDYKAVITSGSAYLTDKSNIKVSQ